MIIHNFTMCLMTVPHTGANFAVGLLSHLDLQYQKYNITHWKTRPSMLPPEPKLLITARDPYLVALRYISKGNPIEHAALSFDNCIANLYNVDYHILDIGCRKEDRLEHVNSIAKFLDTTPDIGTHKFVEAWTPVNTTEEQILRGRVAGGTENDKARYLENGVLPKDHDWSILDNAVDWYKSLSTNDYV